MNAQINQVIFGSLLSDKAATYGIRNTDIDHPFEIHSIEWMEAHHSSRNRRSCFELIWIKKGAGVLQVGGHHYELTNNTIYRVAPGYPRSCFPERGAEGYYISFTPEFMRLTDGYAGSPTWMEQPGDRFNVTVVRADEDMQYELEVIVRKMKREYVNYFSRKDELLKGLLNIFMIYFSRNLKESVPDTAQTRETELARKFMTLLKKNFVSQKMVSNYAGQLFVTPNYLNRTVKKITGFTASHHIQQQIILEAKRQAMYSTVSMKEIAYSLGFDNLAHFSKFFKNNCGVNFTDFKKGILSKEGSL